MKWHRGYTSICFNKTNFSYIIKTLAPLAVRIYYFLLLYILPLTAHAQGFSMFNNRNHPDLDWQVAETEHFQIMYPAHLAGIENDAAPIAEASYAALSSNFDVTFDEKIRIYLSDEDEILNGFAVRLGYTNIWVHVNDVARQWSGDTKWLRTVIPHELAHLFHGKAIRGNRGLILDYLLGDPMPSFWAEGIAQYQTELWDAYRGEQWLRTATLDDRLSYTDGQSIWNGRLLYAVGNSQLRYLTSQYGDSTLTKILKHRSSYLLGTIKTHDFYEAFEEITGHSYRAFYDEWRRHINIYYNTLAGQMENADSLGTDPLNFPGQYIYDVQYSPDTTQIAIVALTSLSRPVRRLFVIDQKEKKTRIMAEGGIQTPISWHPDGTSIAYAARTRAKNGSIVNDLFVVNTTSKKRKQITFNRRAVAPSFSPQGTQLAFIGSERGTANIFLFDLETSQEEQKTFFKGDVQLSSLQWQPQGPNVAYSIFDEAGKRTIRLINTRDGSTKSLNNSLHEDQYPVWHPTESKIAFTSLRDEVPNVFIHDIASDSTHRVTRLVTGATVYDWLPADSAFSSGSLIVSTSATKQRDRAYRISSSRRTHQPDIATPASYSRWLHHAPPATVSRTISADPSAVKSRYTYKPLKNLTHAASLALPYYNSSDDWGVTAFTSWSEPLAKHSIGLLAGMSIPDITGNSFVFLTYVNNTLKPTLSFNLYKILFTPVAYGNTYALQEQDGLDAMVSWPLDVAVRPYTSTRLNLQARYYTTSLFNDRDYDPPPTGLLAPQNGEEFRGRLSITRKKQRPYKDNIIHPLDGLGVRLTVEGAIPALGGDSHYIQGSVSAFAVIPMIGLHRLYIYGKAEAQSGTVFNQNRLGFARFDDIQITAPLFGTIALTDADRVRGYRSFAYGNQLLFGTAEYRMPFLPSLQTTLLGFLSLGSTTLSAFMDTGGVWNKGTPVTRRFGAGAEIKNTLTLGGVFQLMHAVGIAQPGTDIGTSENYEVYYRIRTTIPF